MNPITLKLGENNEIKFKLQIQGITSNPTEVKPKIRFLITEKESEDCGFLLPVIKESNGQITINVFGDNHKFTQEKIYEGKIEVLIGNHYFNAANYDIQFLEEMKIQVESIQVNNKNLIKEDKEQEINIETELVQEQIKQENTKTLVKEETSDNIIENIIKDLSIVDKEYPIKKDKPLLKDLARKVLSEKLNIPISNSKLDKLSEQLCSKILKVPKY